MKMKKQVFNILLLSLIVPVLFFTNPADSKTIFVDQNNISGVEDGTNNNPFNTIQEGINDAVPEDTVKVSSGTYNENITITGINIKLVGENPDTTVIRGTSNVVTIGGTYSTGYQTVEIEGFTITGGSGDGISLTSYTLNAVIHNNIITANNYGINAKNTSGSGRCKVLAYNNLITENSGDGIRTEGYYNDVTIRNNIIIKNGVYGVDLTHSSSSLNASYNNVWSNVTDNFYGNITLTENISANPGFIANSFQLDSGSPSIDAGSQIAADFDPDGTRNDQGVYGGPGAVNFWPGSAGGPVVTELSVTPSSVVAGGTISIKATGKIR